MKAIFRQRRLQPHQRVGKGADELDPIPWRGFEGTASVIATPRR